MKKSIYEGINFILVMKKPTIECSRCKFRIEGNDPDYDERKKRHVEGRHTAHKTKSERDGSIISKGGMGNLDIGKVKWITVW